MHSHNLTQEELPYLKIPLFAIFFSSALVLMIELMVVDPGIRSSNLRRKRMDVMRSDSFFPSKQSILPGSSFSSLFMCHGES